MEGYCTKDLYLLFEKEGYGPKLVHVSEQSMVVTLTKIDTDY